VTDIVRDFFDSMNDQSSKSFVALMAQSDSSLSVNDSCLITIPKSRSVRKRAFCNENAVYDKLIRLVRDHIESDDQGLICMFKYSDQYIGVSRQRALQLLREIIDYTAHPDVEKYEIAAKAHRLLLLMEGNTNHRQTSTVQ